MGRLSAVLAPSRGLLKKMPSPLVPSGVLSRARIEALFGLLLPPFPLSVLPGPISEPGFPHQHQPILLPGVHPALLVDPPCTFRPGPSSRCWARIVTRICLPLAASFGIRNP